MEVLVRQPAPVTPTLRYAHATKTWPPGRPFLSLLLEELCTATPDPVVVQELARLRNEAEAAPPDALTQLTLLLFQVSDRC